MEEDRAVPSVSFQEKDIGVNLLRIDTDGDKARMVESEEVVAAEAVVPLLGRPARLDQGWNSSASRELLAATIGLGMDHKTDGRSHGQGR